MAPGPKHIVVEENFPIPLRDGVVTAADVYRPASGRYPVLLARQSYSKGLPLTLRTAFSSGDPYRIAHCGYAVVIQDGRGAPGIDGILDPFQQEIEDGYDSVEYLAQQPWCDGNVGMVGRSYLGAASWLAAVSAPPSLKAIAPGITGSSTYDWAYQDGAFQLGFALTWAFSAVKPHVVNQRRLGRPRTELDDRFDRSVNNLAAQLRVLPLTAMDGLRIGAPPNPYYEWLEHPSFDEYWRATDLSHRYGEIGCASFNMGGWFDLFIRGTIDNFCGMRAKGATPAGRASRLVVGPWGHDNPYRRYLGLIDYGEAADPDVIDLDGMQLAFFDYWLKGIDNGFSKQAPVRIFVMGLNQWRDEAEWPLARTQWQEWYLHSNGRANSLAGDGSLSRVPPGNEPPDRFTYDPNDPVPTWGGPSRVHGVAPKGPQDQRCVETRQDVLVFTSAPLPEPTEITGPVRLRLWAGTDAPDTDFTAKLVNVHPNGRAICITDGIVRARYRTSLEHPTAVNPGEPYCYEIQLGPTSIVLPAGHRIRLEVSSSNFPRFDRNLNTGLSFDSSEVSLARQFVLHDAAHPSALILPVIPD